MALEVELRDVREPTSVPVTTRACTLMFLLVTVTLTLYGYLRGYYYSFVGPFIIIVCIVILVRGPYYRRSRRNRRNVLFEGPLNLTSSETELARNDPMAVIRRRLSEMEERGVSRTDAQQSLLERYDQRNNNRIWRRPPSYCENGKPNVSEAPPPSYQEAVTTNLQSTSSNQTTTLHDETGTATSTTSPTISPTTTSLPTASSTIPPITSTTTDREETRDRPFSLEENLPTPSEDTSLGPRSRILERIPPPPYDELSSEDTATSQISSAQPSS